MVRDNFAIFILSHGRANKVDTVTTLKTAGYTGKWYFLLDDEDSQIDDYKNLYGKDHVIIFSKKEAINYFDIMDNFEGNKVITFARNALNKIALDMGLEYFWELEDDYMRFDFRIEIGEHLPIIHVRDLDSVIEAFLDYLDYSGIKTIAFAQTGEMLGGKYGAVWKDQIRRKAMNTFFFKTSNPLTFLGRFNDDVNSYITYGKLGDVILQTAIVSLSQRVTQQNSGGIAESYKSFGTYVKSFYSVMLRPDCVHIDVMGKSDRRIHHNINWEYCVPKIISDKFKIKD